MGAKGISLSLTLGGLLSAAPAAALELDKSQSSQHWLLLSRGAPMVVVR